ncbi:DUF58 domain-containing protein [Pseudomonas sp. 5P_3.1_Bac2]|uniref:DUF58 domain-containing protein n=1 Tax=Pseudomonas sp. 5P_3.1_Bac2 TaxID=2971617 RepID=UPI0021C583BA|nr:DUF58 domain-containing protein [Pseudomonas sp. 5P_3.1_Bac2]MCU1716962.1 DUF58 domain-containing protein [Pseudomonas sp. 5P_3.1_Bac2]
MRQLLKGAWQQWLRRRIPAASQVELNQRRIFIIPSQVGLMFMLALVLMLLAAINYQNSLAYALTFLLGSVFVICILHTYRNLAGLQLQAGPVAPVFAGELASFALHLRSHGRAYPALSLGWPGQPLLSVDVPAQGRVSTQLHLSAVQRGWLRPGRLRVETRYPLGLLVAWSWVDLAQRALVYPRPLAGELPLNSGAQPESEQVGQLSRSQGVDDFAGLNPYQPGAGNRRLHWKAYSKGQGLMVKAFSANQGSEHCLDFAALGGDSETRLSLLCHWVLQLSAEQQAFALRLPELEVALGTGASHRDACLQALALYGEPNA